MKNKKIIIGIVTVVLFLVIAAAYLYFEYNKYPGNPKEIPPGTACIQVLVRAHHPTLPFIKQDFGNPCEVPDGWIGEPK
jgi:hypothetical protein